MTWLVDAERVRADKFYKKEDRSRYITAHSLKRLCLADYLGLAFDQLIFETTEKNKPFCISPGAPYFSLSHSGDWAVMAISPFGEIGIDIEPVGREISRDMVTQILSEEQIARVHEEEPLEQNLLLYWTQKEAISKFWGLGLHMDFRTIGCSGRFGRSSCLSLEKELHVHSQIYENDYIISIATDIDRPIEFQKLNLDL